MYHNLVSYECNRFPAKSCSAVRTTICLLYNIGVTMTHPGWLVTLRAFLNCVMIFLRASVRFFFPSELVMGI